MRGLLHDDRGYATVIGAFAIAAVMAITVAVVYVGAAVVARHRAQSAADLAALAASVDHVAAEGDPCAAARAFAAAQSSGAGIRRCTLDGEDVVIVAIVRIPLGPFGTRDAIATAGAGPVD